MDPLDGSSNIDVNVSVGTIFSIYRRVTPVGTPVTEEAISWGLEQFNHPFGQLAFIATTLVGLYPIARQALRLIKSGSYFAIETLMSVAAIGALFIGATAEAAMVLLLFLIGERLEGWAASRAHLYSLYIL